MKRKIVILSILPIFFIGCSQKLAEPSIKMSEPKYAQKLGNKEVEQIDNEGSLFGKGYNPLFSDIKAMKVNDIVIVNISEQAQSTSDRSKKVEKDGALNLGGGLVQPADGKNTNTALTSLAAKINGLTGIGFKSTSNSNFTGSGSQAITENFQTTIASRIVRVLSNGNYFIEGSREILINGEKQLVRITGVIRPYDIGSDNSINSRFISDAKIFYSTDGDLKNVTERGWGAKALDNIWPF